ncbi:DUF362 domain-containing protein [Desulfofundulus thermocisternus]|uniref:DUF362 domain-containing protein n=1 Tax=Desulfofundulus thermocisternus TaxID=42471 RepID=UPI00217DC5E9|nr:DUF362 domain-containing protein [Desulfofundulus thermocisternus]MCS5695035.1 DUF362 domain-containing protein [Desulfofundulus thermocisternus]
MAVVSIVRYKPEGESLRRAIELCEGFAELKSHARVLIKPNVVIGDEKYRNFVKGVLTSVPVLEELIGLLREFGCQNITIGEGSITNEEMGLSTGTAFTLAGIGEMARRLGVNLIDFHQQGFVKIDLDGHQVEVAEAALEADFLINVPVLKTHVQTKVSLGLKNLKGTLSMTSRRIFHRYGVEKYIALLAGKLKPQLTVLDGLYTVNYGPVHYDYRELNLLVAGRDPLAVDVVGSSILGIPPERVEHLVIYASLQGRRPSLEGIEVRGEKISQVAIRAEWETTWLQNIINSFGIKGIRAQTPGPSLCSGCMVTVNNVLRKFGREYSGATFDNIEICTGREPRPFKDSRLVFLFGNCSLESNPEVEGAIKVKGCPLSFAACYEALKRHAIPL